VGLVLSTLFLGWSVVAQQQATQVARSSLRADSFMASGVMVTPATFYTVPLIVGVVAALAMKSVRGLKWNAVGLVLSTLYLGWSVVAQQQATQVARASLRAESITPAGLLVTPAPFNTVLWRLVATTPTQYLEGHTSLLDRDASIVWSVHDRGPALIERHKDDPNVARMAAFTHGFYSVSQRDDRLYVTDLRMGQEPSYTFRFDLGTAAARANGGHRPTLEASRPDIGVALPWLWRRIQGEPLPSPLLPPATPRFTSPK
jgi:inner membrane protein